MNSQPHRPLVKYSHAIAVPSRSANSSAQAQCQFKKSRLVSSIMSRRQTVWTLYRSWLSYSSRRMIRSPMLHFCLPVITSFSDHWKARSLTFCRSKDPPRPRDGERRSSCLRGCTVSRMRPALSRCAKGIQIWQSNGTHSRSQPR